MAERRGEVGSRLLRAATALGPLLLAVLLGVPLLALLLRVPAAAVLARIAEPEVLAALKLSLVSSAAATMVVVLLGLPTAYLMATRRFPGKRALEVVLDLPMVLPPTVAGFALLLAFGRNGLLGSTLSAFGITLPFTTIAVVVAQVFMSVPFFIAPARAGFSGVERRYLDAAATLRAGEGYTFRRVILPLSLPSVLAGTAMAWARSLGEFGATITFAGNLPGRTQTMPLAVYVELQSDLDRAVALSVLLVLMSAILLLALRYSPVGLLGRKHDAPLHR
ncbi:MAG TPA: ABC transporter permease [Gemmatimonadales bacterium]|nr:ABC transporter permease [Gemmatimonadales bacterium]